MSLFSIILNYSCESKESYWEQWGYWSQSLTERIQVRQYPCSLIAGDWPRGWKVNSAISYDCQDRRILLLAPNSACGVAALLPAWSSAIKDSAVPFAFECNWLLSSSRLNAASELLLVASWRTQVEWSNEHLRCAQKVLESWHILSWYSTQSLVAGRWIVHGNQRWIVLRNQKQITPQIMKYWVLS